MPQKWKNRPEGSNWGDFGPDDQLGRINLITPDKVKAAAQEVREGLRFSLSLPLDYPGGSELTGLRHPPVLSPTEFRGKPYFPFAMNYINPELTDIICDDAVLLHLQYSTQWDALSHVGSLFDADGDGELERVFYNGHSVNDGATGKPLNGAAGAANLGIEHMAAAGVQGRGVMVDLYSRYGREKTVVGYEALMQILAEDEITVEEGDFVCFWTGFDDLLLEMKKQPDPAALHNSCAVLDGRDEQLRQWVTDTGVVALISDNFAVEDTGAAIKETHGHCWAHMPLHEHCLFKLGIHLGELWLLSELSNWLTAHKRSRFLLTAPPLRLPGAVGSPACPVATV